MLLDLCVKHNMVVANTVFQQANKYKASWMHPHSHHWHVIDYVLTKQPPGNTTDTCDASNLDVVWP